METSLAAIRTHRSHVLILVAMLALLATDIATAHADAASAEPLTGTIELPTGEPLPDATVMVTAVSQDDVPVDETVEHPIIGTAETDDAGWFSIDLPRDQELTQAALENDGQLNLFVDVFQQATALADGTGAVGNVESTVWGAATTTAAVVVGTWGQGEGLALSAPNPVYLTAGQILANPTTASIVTGGLAAANGCGQYETVLETGTPDIVIGEYHLWDGMSGYFSYGATADSDLGVGYSSSSTGPWKVSSSVHIGNRRSTGTSMKYNASGRYGKHLRQRFKYNRSRFRYYCPGYSYTYYRIYAKYWVPYQTIGGDVSNWDGPTQYNKSCMECRTRISPGDEFTRHKNDAYTYRGSINVMGAQLTAQSGFSVNVQSHWKCAKSRSGGCYLFTHGGTTVTATIIYAS